MSDFFKADPAELLKKKKSDKIKEKEEKIEAIKEKILDDFEELRAREEMVYPDPIKPLWKN